MRDTREEMADYVDALDHIARVCRGSRSQTRRIRWIEARARCALEGGKDYRDIDLPATVDSQARYNWKLKNRIVELEDFIVRNGLKVPPKPESMNLESP